MQVSLPTGQTHTESAQAGGVRFLSRDLANSRNVALPKNPDALEVFTKCIFNVGEADEDEEEDTSLANPTSCTPWDHLPAPVFGEIYQDVEDDHLQTLGSAEVYEDIAIQAEDTYYAIPTLRTSLDPILAANDDKLDAELTDPDETRSVMGLSGGFTVISPVLNVLSALRISHIIPQRLPWQFPFPLGRSRGSTRQDTEEPHHSPRIITQPSTIHLIQNSQCATEALTATHLAGWCRRLHLPSCVVLAILVLCWLVVYRYMNVTHVQQDFPQHSRQSIHSRKLVQYIGRDVLL